MTTTKPANPTAGAYERLSLGLRQQRRLVELVADEVEVLRQVPALAWPETEGTFLTGFCPADAMGDKGIEYRVTAPNTIEYRFICENWKQPMDWQSAGKPRFLDYVLDDTQRHLTEAERRLKDHERKR